MDKHFVLVSEVNINEFEEEVNRFLKHGYQFHGQPFTRQSISGNPVRNGVIGYLSNISSSVSFCQAMIKPAQNKGEE